MADFTPDALGMAYVLRHPNGPVGTYITDRTKLLAILAKQQVGVKTGALRRSIGFKVVSSVGGVVGTVTAADKKAIMHHNGTRPHTIFPVNGQTLRFPVRGKIVYAKVVHHPGTKPNKFLTDNLRKVI
jgi:hypothetical protein